MLLKCYFSGIRYNSPGFDLSYYAFLGLDHNVRDNHLDELLELYKGTFNCVTDDFGHPEAMM